MVPQCDMGTCLVTLGDMLSLRTSTCDPSSLLTIRTYLLFVPVRLLENCSAATKTTKSPTRAWNFRGSAERDQLSSPTFVLTKIRSISRVVFESSLYTNRVFQAVLDGNQEGVHIPEYRIQDVSCKLFCVMNSKFLDRIASILSCR